MKHTHLALMLIGFVLSFNIAFSNQYASTETEKFYVAGSPTGEVTSGVMARPAGFDLIRAIQFNPQVVWMKIEQNDYAVPEIGPNPNKIYYEGNPNAGQMVPIINMNGIGDLRITVKTSGNSRIAQAVLFQWGRGRR